MICYVTKIPNKPADESVSFSAIIAVSEYHTDP